VVEVDGYVTARKVATATMSQAKIWATLGECNLWPTSSLIDKVRWGSF